MILSDREIRAALDRGAVRLFPTPPATAWSSTAVDLTLAKDVVSWKQTASHGATTIIAPANPGFNFTELIRNYGETHQIGEGGFIFAPGAFLLGWTVEKLRLPFRSRIAARVEGKSSLARIGIGVHVTAPTIHAGFGDKKDDESYCGSQLQLEIWNTGPLHIQLDTGMPICQLIFEWVDGTPEKGYEGRFSVQGPNS